MIAERCPACVVGIALPREVAFLHSVDGDVRRKSSPDWQCSRCGETYRRPEQPDEAPIPSEEDPNDLHPDHIDNGV